MNTICEICGSENIVSKISNTVVSVPYHASINHEIFYYYCEDCDSEVDVESADDTLQHEIDIAEKQSVIDMIDFLSQSDINLTGLERALNLPYRTLSRWKGGKNLTAAALALLRILRTYPWIIDVAQHNFDNIFAQKTLVKEGVNQFLEISSHCSNDFIGNFGKVNNQKWFSFWKNGYSEQADEVAISSSDSDNFLDYRNQCVAEC
ncbi:MAG: hypothetical protein CVV64_11450 [Candidatus Wallbacteria bacterium HGW-Wallbacteria-1]|jgi:DNA-binding transcriptional regulator YiaG|uniref:Uncharacterized protein n=1 Tax=Candidatus Wallbacteria bacterium HGW-Wallbacteria-1 TaxID=2013854 RepID=A0A2N1PNU0_9BACT|nr:MAG: hypothetical protein CVV64_11450 [Candidatus Wallbacteria bacterium HGW-Wallbacteria-1]